MNKTQSVRNVRHRAYAPPSLRTCECVTESGFAQSSDFDNLDFDNRDEE